MQFADLLAHSRLSLENLQELTGRHRTTLRRWLDQDSAPLEIRRLVDIIGHGRPPSYAQAWDGWRFMGDILMDPDGQGVSPDEVRSVWICRQLQAELKRLHAAPVQYLLF
ncbi:hypothetical protein H0Z60_12925 [Ectothiorhodospiraceae bacterium WFHF3C12]|nr:hypothetical protein [Ectothiorhodospiraceae bacterium WFHF3C12]